jgi:hypothetical protein
VEQQHAHATMHTPVRLHSNLAIDATTMLSSVSGWVLSVNNPQQMPANTMCGSTMCRHVSGLS